MIKWILEFFKRHHCSLCGELRLESKFFDKRITCAECNWMLKDRMRNKDVADSIHMVETMWTPYNLGREKPLRLRNSERKEMSPFELSTNKETNGQWWCLNCSDANSKDRLTCSTCNVKRDERTLND